MLFWRSPTIPVLCVQKSHVCCVGARHRLGQKRLCDRFAVHCVAKHLRREVDALARRGRYHEEETDGCSEGGGGAMRASR
ncbi:hypothetical protein GUJ93_ZPchr0001g32998 [Zizania palustris]|uniref:Uncharacterized protein n=1 Tax=Zizania palustris TaxID=103762 RepID=A0A8J5R7E2_ZIZPA|nr:hypothetical protein GUJ93_ZPchr0001g32998 [Zizania palustris]